ARSSRRGSPPGTWGRRPRPPSSRSCAGQPIRGPLTAPRRILALGGHDFDRRVGNDVICDLIVDLAESPRPRVCLLPTASGDPEDQIARFRRAFAERDCEPAWISLFRLGERPVELRDELL